MSDNCLELICSIDDLFRSDGRFYAEDRDREPDCVIVNRREIHLNWRGRKYAINVRTMRT